PPPPPPPPPPRPPLSSSFVDDKDQNTLENMALEIRENIATKEAKLLLSSSRYMDNLLDNVMKNGIFECYDGIKEITTLVNNYYKQKFQGERVVAVILDGFGVEQKHLGDIVKILEQKNFKILYIVFYTSVWLKELEEELQAKKKDYILAGLEFMQNLDFFPFVISQVNAEKFHPNVRSLKLYASMDEVPNYVWLNDLFKDRMYKECIDLNFYQSFYINIHSQTHYEDFYKTQQFFNLDPNPSYRLIKGGYPSIEKEVVNFAKQREEVFRDTVIFISALLNHYYPKFLSKIIHNVLNAGFRVVFKSCPAHCELEAQEDEFVENGEFEKNPNFLYWRNDKPKLSIEELNRSIVAIEAASSMMYSYPVITKRPAILLYPKKDSIPQDLLEQDCFYHKDLHIRIFEEDSKDLIEILQKLSMDKKYQKEWERKIQKYCKEDLYNFGNASEYLANWIVEWYNKREILKDTP
ncbi:MAG: hypothetical protein K2I71_01445, partial [Helicobacter sp.]|nr:hypothetical protein [Helicobacter sp.]